MEGEKYEEAFSSDVGIQEFYKLFKYVSSKSSKVLLPGLIIFKGYLTLSSKFRVRKNILEIIRSANTVMREGEKMKKNHYYNVVKA